MINPNATSPDSRYKNRPEEVIYDDAVDVHVRNRFVFLQMDDSADAVMPAVVPDSYAYYDRNLDHEIDADALENLFYKGLILKIPKGGDPELNGYLNVSPSMCMREYGITKEGERLSDLDGTIVAYLIPADTSEMGPGYGSVLGLANDACLLWSASFGSVNVEMHNMRVYYANGVEEDSSVINIQASADEAQITIHVNGEVVENGTSVDWLTGLGDNNLVLVMVENEGHTKYYRFDIQRMNAT